MLELDAVGKAAQQLQVRLAKLHRPALDWLSLYVKRLSVLDRPLAGLIAVGEEAAVALAAGGKRTRAGNDPARIVGDLAARHWHQLTGKPPTVIKTGRKTYGSFVDLVTMLFKFLRINASGPSQATTAVDRYGELLNKT